MALPPSNIVKTQCCAHHDSTQTSLYDLDDEIIYRKYSKIDVKTHIPTPLRLTLRIERLEKASRFRRKTGSCQRRPPKLRIPCTCAILTFFPKPCERVRRQIRVTFVRHGAFKKVDEILMFLFRHIGKDNIHRGRQVSTILGLTSGRMPARRHVRVTSAYRKARR